MQIICNPMNTRIIIENSKSYAKIGLVTFHDFNYGSALQCFATQKYLGLKGFDCEIIERKPPRVRILGYISTAWSLFSLCLLNPKSFRIILSIFTSERRGALRITDKSESLIIGFKLFISILCIIISEPLEFIYFFNIVYFVYNIVSSINYYS